jgi:hypothetical protein
MSEQSHGKVTGSVVQWGSGVSGAMGSNWVYLVHLVSLNLILWIGIEYFALEVTLRLEALVSIVFLVSLVSLNFGDDD